MIDIFAQTAAWIINSVQSMGYLGILFLMFLESSFFPFPSEVVMIPAGYLAYRGEMDIVLAVAMGIIGSLLGAALNYYLGHFLGRRVLLKYGKYFFISRETFEKAEKKFKRHGEIITFMGRLIPGLRQYISFPPGIAKMNFGKFMLFTGLGAGIWVSTLTLLGYFLGEKQHLVEAYLNQITVAIIMGCAGICLLYAIYLKKRSCR